MTTAENPIPDCAIEAAMQRVRKARDQRIFERTGRKSSTFYTKLDCAARQGAHTAEETIQLPNKD